MKILTLTAAEIRDLARFAGFIVDDTAMPDDDLETKITISNCPSRGIRNEGEPSDPNSMSHYRFTAHCTEYPEEGCVGLGNAHQRDDKLSVWDVKEAFLEWNNLSDYKSKLEAWHLIEQRARELAKESR